MNTIPEIRIRGAGRRSITDLMDPSEPIALSGGRWATAAEWARSEVRRLRAAGKDAALGTNAAGFIAVVLRNQEPKRELRSA